MTALRKALFVFALLATFTLNTGSYVRAADALAAPSGPVILTVDGSITVTNVDGTAQFDRDMLSALGMKKLVTSSPFEPGMHTFEGVLLSDVLSRVGASGETITAKALDGYEIDMPMIDPQTYPVLLATTWNGKIMRIRDKGPIWIVYPVDQFSELNVEEYSSRSVWQMTRLSIR